MPTPIRTRLWVDGNLISDDLPLAEVSDRLDVPGTLVWVDLCNPTRSALDQLGTELGLSTRAVAEVDDRITQQVIDAAVTTMTVIYVNDGGGRQVAAEQAETYGASIPWTEAHYLDPDIPGSLRAEINPTGAYLQAIWDRLHGTFGPDDLVIHVYPEAPRRLRSHDSSGPDSTVTFIFGRGVDVSSIQAVWTDGDEAIAGGQQGILLHRLEAP